MSTPTPRAEPVRRSSAGLLLVGHGSSRIAGSGASVRSLADDLRRRDLFARVHPAFLREPPLLPDVRAELREAPISEIFVVPVLTCRGYICDRILPAALGLDEGRADGSGPAWRICDPVGTHPGMAEIIAARAHAMLASAGLTAGEADLVLAAHGTSRDPESFLQTRRIADALGGHGLPRVHCVFLEQEPRIEAWTAMCRAATVLVIPYMIAAGAHGSIDLPARLGLDPSDSSFAALERQGQAGPFSIAGKTLLYGRAVGSEPGIAEIVLDQVAGCARQFRA